jgi:hypothetical protein
MSINAYRVIDRKMAKASFNLYRDMSLADFLDAEIQIYGDIHDGTGTIDVPVKFLRKALRMSTKLNLDEKTIKQLHEDIEYARFNKDESITYYCF